MGYRKARIPIRLNKENKADFRNGYKFDACFSNGQLFEMGVYKNSKGQWIVSDLNTGLLVNYGKTRVDAVKKFQDVYLSKFERIVSTENYKRESAEFRFITEAGK